MVQKIVSLAENLTSMALTGTGGIGKTSIILTALHDHRIKERFGDNRWFIRCDEFPASHTHFLRKLSQAIGAGVENPEGLSPMRRYLSSKEMLIVLDNAESILGLPETDAREIHTTVGELGQYDNICLVITSRISNTLPPHCEIIEVSPLSMDAGQETFYRIYRLGERSDEINEILKELDFHPLSITLFATVAQQNRWSTERLTADWEKQRTKILRTRNLGSLAATIELSLASPMFQELGPSAREVLGVVAFLPQGVNEDNIGGLFPTVSDGPSTFDAFCNLSLTHRSNGFITMLAPLRDYLRPKDPMASPLLCMAMEHYFMRLSVDVYPTNPGFDESQWIASEDVNVEYLLDIFTSIDADSRDVWGACDHFMNHLYWHKPRLVVLGPKFEALPDNHPSKLCCLFFLSRLFKRVGNWVEQKRILIECLGRWRERGDDHGVAEALADLSNANQGLGLYEEGIAQAREACNIFGRLGETEKQVPCLLTLASLLRNDKQLDAAEEAAVRAVDLLEDRNQYGLCKTHQTLGEIHRSKGDTEKAIHHFKESLRIASVLNIRDDLSRIHLFLAYLYFWEDKLIDAHAHIEQAKSYAGNDMILLGSAFYYGALILSAQTGLEEAKSEALHALAIFEKFGTTDPVEETMQVLKEIDKKIQERDDDG